MAWFYLNSPFCQDGNLGVNDLGSIGHSDGPWRMCLLRLNPDFPPELLLPGTAKKVIFHKYWLSLDMAEFGVVSYSLCYSQLGIYSHTFWYCIDKLVKNGSVLESSCHIFMSERENGKSQAHPPIFLSLRQNAEFRKIRQRQFLAGTEHIRLAQVRDSNLISLCLLIKG